MIFAVSLTILSDGNDNYESDVLGASSTLNITDATALSDIENAVSALNDGDVLTVTGSKTNGSGELYLYIPEGAKVMWDAVFESNSSIYVASAGSFESAEGKLDIGGLKVGDTATATLNGDIDFWGTGLGAGFVYSGAQSLSKLIINGNLTISGDGHGFYAMFDGAEVTINGNLEITGENSAARGWDGGLMTVNGDVIISGNGSSIQAGYGGTTVINGTLTTLDDAKYVSINGTAWYSKNGYAEVSSMDGYYQYTDGTSSVFVKIPTDDDTTSGGETPSDNGNSNTYLIAGAAIAIVAVIGLAYVFVIRKP